MYARASVSSSTLDSLSKQQQRCCSSIACVTHPLQGGISHTLEVFLLSKDYRGSSDVDISAAILYICWAESYPTCLSSNRKNKFWGFFCSSPKETKSSDLQWDFHPLRKLTTWAQYSSDTLLQYHLAGWWQGCPLLLKLQGVQQRNPRAVWGNQNKQVEIFFFLLQLESILPSRSVALAALSAQWDSVTSNAEGGLMQQGLQSTWQNRSG